MDDVLSLKGSTTPKQVLTRLLSDDHGGVPTQGWLGSPGHFLSKR